MLLTFLLKKIQTECALSDEQMEFIRKLFLEYSEACIKDHIETYLKDDENNII